VTAPDKIPSTNICPIWQNVRHRTPQLINHFSHISTPLSQSARCVQSGLRSLAARPSFPLTQCTWATLRRTAGQFMRRHKQSYHPHSLAQPRGVRHQHDVQLRLCLSKTQITCSVEHSNSWEADRGSLSHVHHCPHNSSLLVPFLRLITEFTPPPPPEYVR
jgi:hypothetical protein